MEKDKLITKYIDILNQPYSKSKSLREILSDFIDETEAIISPPKSKFMKEWEKMDRGYNVDYPNQFVENLIHLIDKYKADK